MEFKLNLHQKLVEIRKDIGGFTKDKKSFNYSYVSGTQVLAKIQNKMNELGVLLIPKVTTQEFEKHEYVSSKGKPALDFIVHGQMTYTWLNAENPEETIEVPFFYTGAQDDISKAFGSGLTYSERYFIVKFFNLPTDADDPDARDTSGRQGNSYGNSTQQQQTYNQPPQQQQQRQTYNQPQQPQQPYSNMISDAQIKLVKTKLSIAANRDEHVMVEIFKGCLSNLGFDVNLSSKDLTKPQASKVIDYLTNLAPK